MRNILCLILCLVLVLSLGACSDKGDATSDAAVIYEEEVIYEGDTSTNDNVASKDESTTSTTDTSSNNSSETTVSSKPTASSKPQEEMENIYYLNDATTLKNIKLNGRCTNTDKGISLNMAASAIEFNTDSSSVLLKIDADKGVFYSIMVDGELTVQHQEVKNSQDVFVVAARGLSAGSHNIKFIRDSESRTNTTLIAESIQLDDGAKLLSKDNTKPIIEFLGDSLTSGYGNLVSNGTANSQELKNQSSVKAYPFLLANKLGCDYRIVSMSGIALGKRSGYPSFPEFYNLENYHVDQTIKYTSTSPSDVDVVVVNLGTNDVGAKMYDANSTESVEAYKQHFTNLITNIGYRKDAKIIFVTGVWNKEPITAIKEAMVELNTLGYNNVYSIELKEGKSGGGSHPSEKEHKAYADTLEKFFKEKGII